MDKGKVAKVDGSDRNGRNGTTAGAKGTGVNGKGPGARARGALFLLLAAILALYTGREFLAMHEPDAIYPGPGVTGRALLSEFAPALAGGPADTEVFYLKGELPGGTMLVLGGTHNDEISAQTAAITLIENARVNQGTLIVIPRANASGATYSEEMVGTPYYLELQTETGVRRIRVGSRYVNPAHQFPDPDVYVNVDGAAYPGPESRNLNRVHPGREEGHLIEIVSHGIIELIKAERVDVMLDMHEAVPEHYVVNCIVGHNRAMELTALTIMGLQMQGIEINMFESPPVYGFSHRGIGDNTQAMVVLAETTNILQGSFRGKPTQRLMHDGKDPFYDLLQEAGKIYVQYDSGRGVSLEERVGRHLSTVMELSRSLLWFQPDKVIEIAGVPEFAELVAVGLEHYLAPPAGDSAN